MTRLTWDEWALGIALAVAARADCTRRQVGAVILDSEHRVVSTGYNGYPPGALGCLAGGCPRGQLTYDQLAAYADYTASGCRAFHAEENAILYAHRSLVGCTLYVTCAPCDNCKRVIAGAQVTRVVWPEGGWDVA